MKAEVAINRSVLDVSFAAAAQHGCSCGISPDKLTHVHVCHTVLWKRNRDEFIKFISDSFENWTL